MNKNYLFAGFTALFLASSINAQIIYTDIPDGVPAGIDFNSDGTLEFEISDSGGEGAYITYYNGGNDNNIHAVGSFASGSDWDTPDCVAAGFTIDASGNWEGAGDASINAWGGVNPTVTIGSDEYLAMRFNLGGTELYYGWVRFSMNSSDEVTYKDYAYNSTPGQAINAGDKGGSVGLVSENMKSSIKMYPNPATNTITIQNENGVNVNSLRVISSLGVEMMNVNTNAFEKKTFDVSSLSKGLYFVELHTDGDKIESKRLIIQ